MNKVSFIIVISFSISLFACSKKDSDIITSNNLIVSGINIVYTQNGVPMFTDSAADYDTVHQISLVPLNSNTVFVQNNTAVRSGFYYGDIPDSNYSTKAYMLHISALGKNYTSSATGFDTAEVGIKWANGQIDTLICINGVLYYNAVTSSPNLSEGFSVTKCIYNGIIKYNVMYGENAVLGNYDEDRSIITVEK